MFDVELKSLSEKKNFNGSLELLKNLFKKKRQKTITLIGTSNSHCIKTKTYLKKYNSSGDL